MSSLIYLTLLLFEPQEFKYNEESREACVNFQLTQRTKLFTIIALNHKLGDWGTSVWTKFENQTWRLGFEEPKLSQVMGLLEDLLNISTDDLNRLEQKLVEAFFHLSPSFTRQVCMGYRHKAM